MNLIVGIVIGLVVGMVLVAADRDATSLFLSIAIGGLVGWVVTLHKSVKQLQQRLGLDGSLPIPADDRANRPASKPANKPVTLQTTEASAAAEQSNKPINKGSVSVEQPAATSSSWRVAKVELETYESPVQAQADAAVKKAPAANPLRASAPPSSIVSEKAQQAPAAPSRQVSERNDSSSKRSTGGISIPEPLLNLYRQTNWAVRVGVVLLFLGVSFLVRYAAEQVTVPIEVRLLSIVAVALAVLWWGWRLRGKNALYAQLVQAAAIGVLYITGYGAFKLYGVIPMAVGMAAFVLLSLVAVGLSVRQNSIWLSVLGIAGGFAAPILLSTGSGNHIALFSYYLVLNIGVLAIIAFRPWTPLVIMAFVFTLVIGASWADTAYQAAHYGSTQTFLALFILIYLLAQWLLLLRNYAGEYQRVLSNVLTFGLPVVAIALQAALVADFEYGMAYSYLVFATVYALFWWCLKRQQSGLPRYVYDSYLGVAAVFGSLAIPAAFAYDLSGILWALEALAALYLALRQQRLWAVGLALLAQIAAGGFWLLSEPAAGDTIFLNGSYLRALLMSLVAFASAWLVYRFAVPLDSGGEKVRKADEPRLPAATASLQWPLFVLGCLWWAGAAIWQLAEHLGPRHGLEAFIASLVGLVAVTQLLLSLAARRFDTWAVPSASLLAGLPALGLLFLSLLLNGIPTSATYGLLLWPLALSVIALSLRWLRHSPTLESWRTMVTPLAVQTIASVYLGTALIVWELLWQIDARSWAFVWSMWAIAVPATVLAMVVYGYQRSLRGSLLWPNEAIVWPMAAITLCSGLLCLVLPLDTRPLAYRLLASPLDWWPLLSVGIAWRLLRHSPAVMSIAESRLWAVMVGYGFAWLNVLWLRAVHRFAGVPYDVEALFSSEITQVGFSVLWSALGFALVLLSVKIRSRISWIAGMAIFALVVVKLLLVDMSNSGTIARIVSFIAVGLILLAIGYFIPIPDDDDEEEVDRDSRGA